MQGRTIYCHFSFRRPKGKDYGIFAVAFYNDFEGKKKIGYVTRKYPLWANQQFISAIQSYEHALMTIHDYQGMMKRTGITQVMLVTDNSTLAKWIENPKKNKEYYPYMERANRPYRPGQPKEIVLGIGLCEPRDYEKSYKYCREDLVENNYPEAKGEDVKGYKIDIGESYQSVLDIIGGDLSSPEISDGMTQL